MKNHSILSGFIRALNHRLRTPLSVVSNDLEALRPQLPSDAYERMRRRITQISDMLRSLQRFSAAANLDATVALDELLREIAVQRGAAAVLGAIEPARVQGSEALLRAAIDGIFELLQTLPGTAVIGMTLKSGAPAARAELVIEASSGTLAQQAPASCASLTEYFNETLDLDALSPPCIDSILASHRATVSVDSGTGLRVLVSLPSIS